MKEREWIKSKDPGALLLFLAQAKISERKRRLFGCACCRLIWHRLFRESLRNAVEVAEKFADGAIGREEIEVVRDEMNAAAAEIDFVDELEDAADAVRAVRDAVWGGDWQVAQHAARCAWKAKKKSQVGLIRDIFGNPFRPVTINPAWRTSNVTALAQAIYDDRAFDRLPILADALEDAGCDNADILNHCRQPGVHVRGCWVVDLVLGKE
jgi:hypothetical protein